MYEEFLCLGVKKLTAFFIIRTASRVENIFKLGSYFLKKFKDNNLYKAETLKLKEEISNLQHELKEI